jgi:hypothetical protein
VDVKKISEVKAEKGLQGYDAYLLGSPTYHRDMIGTMKIVSLPAQRWSCRKIGGRSDLTHTVATLPS